MSYLVLARKWRPAVFEGVIGQNHVTTTLKNAITSKRIAHAYLFSGPRGVGKTTIARILAKALNCVQGPTPTPCNECQSCKEITNNISVDVVEIDGASNTSVDNVREIRENVKYVPSHGRYRIYIIDEVHMLSNQAFNALLKTLEEPPAHAIFMFATTEPHKIPPTIVSRCQRFDFKRISLKEVQSHLALVAKAEGIKITEEGVYLIAKEVEGSLRDAHSFLDQAVAFAGNDIKDRDVIEALGLMDRTLLFQLSGAVINRNGGDCLKLIEKIYNFGYDFKRFYQDFLEHIRDLVIIQAVDDPKAILDIPDSEIDDLKRLADNVSLLNLLWIFTLLNKGYEDIARSPSPRLILEMTLLKIVHLENLEPINSILSNLEEVKAYNESVPSKTVSERPDGKMDRASVPSNRLAEAHVKGDKWTEFLDYIRKKRPSLTSHLEMAGSVVMEKSTIFIKVKHEPYYAYLTESKKVIEQLGNEFFGRKMVVDIKTGVGGEIPRVREHDRVIKDVVKIFGGKVIEDRRRANE